MKKHHATPRATILALAIAAALPCQQALAYEFDTGGSDVKVSWNNTIKYSAAYRLKDADGRLLAGGYPSAGPADFTGYNLDDGNQNFRNKGVVSNRVDWLTEFDAGTRNLGMRVSAAAWYDSVYNSSNDNASPGSNAAVLTGGSNNRFTSATRELHGRNAELLDAFVFAKGTLGEMPGTVRVGRHTLQYGESLFFGANGIANAQGPVDLVKLLSVPGAQFKEILRPVNQISGQLQLLPNLSLGAYYQLEWRPTQIPGVGSYLSNYDAAGAGSTAFLVAPNGSGAPAFLTIADMKTKDSGQGGAQLKFTPAGSDIELGLYAARYHDKTPYFYLGFAPAFPPGAPATVQAVYAQGIKTYGVSASTVLGGFNVAAELSVRRNTPLVSDPTPNFLSRRGVGIPADNGGNPAYAVGNTAHANLSAIYVLPTNSLFEGGALLGELAWNRRTSVSFLGSLDPNTTRDATSMRMIFEPAFYQVVTGLDLTVPIGLGYNIDGRSSSVFNFNGGSAHGGDFNIGVSGSYQQDWKFGISYVRFLGSTGTFLKNNPATNMPILSYAQSLKDRNYISLNIKRAF
ncbi:DUF1302 domain-containing protein [Pseudoduganella namucuonensis]|uniref:DUF1302 family protein n=1 Tax=Pseudoduganella namucuonensis TaxID=1035707 RepID=A0A1I7L7G5_9BURK|nr:DUF1302 domain-containing protein [Pseudoduganella namucuonensis]SFV05585.1 Protein of unknown function [Pseudoduganella namucuonensis]